MMMTSRMFTDASLSTMDDDARGIRERGRRHDAWKIFVYLVYSREWGFGPIHVRVNARVSE